MLTRRFAQASAFLGGVALILWYVIERPPVWWAGLALVGVGCVCLGAGLVSSSAPALRAFTALAFPMLVGSVWWMVRAADDGSRERLVDVGLGALAVVAAVISGSRNRRHVGIRGAHL